MGEELSGPVVPADVEPASGVVCPLVPGREH